MKDDRKNVKCKAWENIKSNRFVWNLSTSDYCVVSCRVNSQNRGVYNVADVSYFWDCITAGNKTIY